MTQYDLSTLFYVSICELPDSGTQNKFYFVYHIPSDNPPHSIVWEGIILFLE